MDAEEREFHAHMAKSMRELMQTFSSGYSALERAKSDEKLLSQEMGEQYDGANDEQETGGMIQTDHDDLQAQSSQGKGDITLVA